jgi:hypothetical protein
MYRAETVVCPEWLAKSTWEKLFELATGTVDAGGVCRMERVKTEGEDL